LRIGPTIPTIIADSDGQIHDNKNGCSKIRMVAATTLFQQGIPPGTSTPTLASPSVVASMNQKPRHQIFVMLLFFGGSGLSALPPVASLSALGYFKDFDMSATCLVIPDVIRSAISGTFP
jgi:hypothetical protein